MRMARLNVYVPDNLAERARARGLNVSALTQEAIRSALAAADTNAWLDEISVVPSGVSHEAVIAALDDARAEFGE